MTSCGLWVIGVGKPSKREPGVIYSVFESMKYRMRYIDSIFNRISVGDNVVLNSEYYKHERMRVIQKTEHLIILEKVSHRQVRTAVSKADYFCGACRFELINNGSVEWFERWTESAES